MLASCINNPHQGTDSTLFFSSPTAAKNIRRGVRIALANRRSPLKVKSHGAVYLHHRRRGLLAWKGSGIGGARRLAAGQGLQGPPSQARSLSQSRSRNDVAVSARRSLRDR